MSQVTFPSHLGITETRLHRYKTPLEAEYILSGRLAAYATCVASWRCLHPTPSLSLHTCTYTPEEETTKEPCFKAQKTVHALGRPAPPPAHQALITSVTGGTPHFALVCQTPAFCTQEGRKKVHTGGAFLDVYSCTR